MGTEIQPSSEHGKPLSFTQNHRDPVRVKTHIGAPGKVGQSLGAPMPKSTCEHSLREARPTTWPLPRATGPLPFDPETQLPKPLRRRRLKDAAQGCSILSHYLRVFVTKTPCWIVLHGFRAGRAAGKPAQKQNRHREAPKIKKLYMFIRINRSTHECAHCKPPSAPRGCRQAQPPGRSQVGGRRSGLRGVRAGCACTLPGFNASLPPFLLSAMSMYYLLLVKEVSGVHRETARDSQEAPSDEFKEPRPRTWAACSGQPSS